MEENDWLLVQPDGGNGDDEAQPDLHASASSNSAQDDSAGPLLPPVTFKQPQDEEKQPCQGQESAQNDQAVQVEVACGSTGKLHETPQAQQLLGVLPAVGLDDKPVEPTNTMAPDQKCERKQHTGMQEDADEAQLSSLPHDSQQPMQVQETVVQAEEHKEEHLGAHEASAEQAVAEQEGKEQAVPEQQYKQQEQQQQQPQQLLEGQPEGQVDQQEEQQAEQQRDKPEAVRSHPPACTHPWPAWLAFLLGPGCIVSACPSDPATAHGESDVAGWLSSTGEAVGSAWEEMREDWVELAAYVRQAVHAGHGAAAQHARLLRSRLSKAMKGHAPSWALISLSAVTTVALVAVGTLLLANHRLANQLKQRDKELARLVLRIMNMQELLQSSRAAAPILRLTTMQPAFAGLG